MAISLSKSHGLMIISLKFSIIFVASKGSPIIAGHPTSTAITTALHGSQYSALSLTCSRVQNQEIEPLHFLLPQSKNTMQIFIPVMTHIVHHPSDRCMCNINSIKHYQLAIKSCRSNLIPYVVCGNTVRYQIKN